MTTIKKCIVTLRRTRIVEEMAEVVVDMPANGIPDGAVLAAMDIAKDAGWHDADKPSQVMEVNADVAEVKVLEFEPTPEGKSLIAKSPDGSLIIATLDRMLGTAGIHSDSFRREADGKVTCESDGSGTEVDWDGQETVTERGQFVYIDENGDNWLESQLVLEEAP